jgi:hypothetical protein
MTNETIQFDLSQQQYDPSTTFIASIHVIMYHVAAILEGGTWLWKVVVINGDIVVESDVYEFFICKIHPR